MLIDLLKSIDFKTFNSKEIKFINRKEIIKKPKYRQFWEEINISTLPIKLIKEPLAGS